MGKIYIDHLYICSSYNEAKELSENFKKFKSVFRGLGVKRTINPKCFIRKRTDKSVYTYTLNVRYKIDFTGEFCDYGFLDKRTLTKHPDLPDKLIKVEDKFDRWELVFDCTEDDDDMYDPEFYEDFQEFFDKKLKIFIDKLYLSEVIALPKSRSGGLYIIYYQENSKTYEMRYGAEKGPFSFVKSIDKLNKLETLDFQKTWYWVNKTRKYQRDEWKSEARP